MEHRGGDNELFPTTPPSPLLIGPCLHTSSAPGVAEELPLFVDGSPDAALATQRIAPPRAPPVRRRVARTSQHFVTKLVARRTTKRSEVLRGPTAQPCAPRAARASTPPTPEVQEGERAQLVASQYFAHRSKSALPCVLGETVASRTSAVDADVVLLGTQRFAALGTRRRTAGVAAAAAPLARCPPPVSTAAVRRDDEDLCIGEPHGTSTVANQPISPVDAHSAGTTPRVSAVVRELCAWTCLKDVPWTLDGFSLPQEIVGGYRAHRGIEKLIPWQRACLFTYYRQLADDLAAVDATNSGNPQKAQPARPPDEEPATTRVGNLLYSAPTSGGKTLVAEVILLRRLHMLGEGKKAMFIVPYVAIAEEKTASLERLVSGTGMRVGCHAGQRGTRSVRDDILVCTPEKAYHLVNLLVESHRIDELCVVVVDELHHIGDANGSRGHLLELLVTKLVRLSQDGQGQLQIIALSATLRNSEQLAKWMNGASLFITDYRPVPLEEFCVCRGVVYDASGNITRQLYREGEVHAVDTDDKSFALLAVEAGRCDAQSLVFCPSRALCEKSAAEIVRLVNHQAKSSIAAQDLALLGPKLTSAAKRRAQFSAQLEKLAGPSRTTALPPNEGQCLPPLVEPAVTSHPSVSALLLEGVVFHHAALTHDERAVIEEAFRSGAVWVLCCTTTLATGVNLPVRRVIFTAPRIANQVLDGPRYKQAAGRAGRLGLDCCGESFLCCKPSDKALALRLISTTLPPVKSNFSADRKGMTRVLLEGIMTKTIRKVEDIERTIRQTLLFVTCGDDYGVVFSAAKQALEFLEAHELIQWSVEDENFSCTLLGEAAAASSLAPDEALTVFDSLDRSRRNVVLTVDLHVVYFCTPMFHGIEPNWSLYSALVSRLGPDEQLVAQLVGVSEGFLVGAAAAPPPRTLLTPECVVHRRFYASLILAHAVQETPLDAVARKFRLPMQDLHKLMESSASFSSMVATFCDKLNWWALPPILRAMGTRLQRGVEPELVPLMAIPGLVPWRARELFKRGYRTVLSIAMAPAQELESAVSLHEPFELALRSDSHVANDNCDPLAVTRPKTAKEIVSVLQQCARTALLNEASNLLESVEEIRAVVGPLRPHPAVINEPRPAVVDVHCVSTCPSTADALRPSKRRPRSPLALVVNRDSCPNDKHVANASGVRRIEWLWLHPGTAAEDWSLTTELLLSECSLVSVVTVAPTTSSVSTASHPVVVLHAASESSRWKSHFATETVFVIDDGCIRGDGNDETAAAAQQNRQRHRGMRFVVEQLLPAPHVTKAINGVKEWLLDLLDGAWLHPPGNLEQLVHSASDPVIAEWLLAPEDRSPAAVRQASIRSIAERLGIRERQPLMQFQPRDGLRSQQLAARASAVLFSTRVTSTDMLGAFRGYLVDAVLLRDVTETLHRRLNEMELMQHFVSVEMPIAVCLAKMEFWGLALDPAEYERAMRLMALKARTLEEEAYAISGTSRWSLACPRDCAKILFDVMHLPCLERTFDTKYLPCCGGKRRRDRIAKESRSTRATVLRALTRLFPDNRIPAIISEHRTMIGWTEKYLVPLLQLGKDPGPKVRERNGPKLRQVHLIPAAAVGGNTAPPSDDLPAVQDVGCGSTRTVIAPVVSGTTIRIRGRYVQTATATGRLTMNEPNLQTIPHPIQLLLAANVVPPALRPFALSQAPEPNAKAMMFRVALRNAFVASPGCLFISADFCQIEARLLAHFSRDTSLLATLQRSTAGGHNEEEEWASDIFVAMAATVFNIPVVEVGTEKRKQAKALCYGMLYGKGKASIADDLEISEEEAEGVLCSFHRAFPAAHAFLNETAHDAQQAGFVETISKRKRWLPYAASRIPKFRAASARIAVNTLCQGSAADLVKVSMLRLQSLSDFQGPSPTAKLLLQIHDELLMECKESSLSDCVGKIAREMQSIAAELSLTVPFTVKISVGPTWGSLVRWTVPH